MKKKKNLPFSEQPTRKQDEVINEGAFKALQKKWYARLAEEGFKDIEDTNSPREYLKTWHSNYFAHRYTPTTFQSKEDYYRRAAQFLHTHAFPWREGSSLIHWKDKEIWRLHTEGKSLRMIAKELTDLDLPLNKDQAHQVISRLSKLMMDDDEPSFLLRTFEESFFL